MCEMPTQLLTVCIDYLSVDDASGHYTTGLFYGNNYWIGSLSLCKSIYKDTTSDAPLRGT